MPNIIKDIVLEINGLTTVVSQEAVEEYFQYKTFEWSHQKRHNVLMVHGLGVETSEGRRVGWGGIQFLKRNNPEFASRVLVKSIGSMSQWLPLDPSILDTFSIEWRKPQVDAVKACARAVVGNLVMGMGIGKTDTIAVVARASLIDSEVVLVIAPTVKTRDNLMAGFMKAGLSEAFEYCGNCPSKGIVVANSDTLNRRYEFFDVQEFLAKVGTLLVDESHNFTKDSWNLLLTRLPNLHRLLGFSGTSSSEKDDIQSGFLNMDHKAARTICACGPTIYRVPHEEYIEYIDLPDVYNLVYEWPKEPTEEMRELRDWTSIRILRDRNEHRDAFIVDALQKLREVGRCIVVVVNDKLHISKLSKKLGDKSALIWLGSNKIEDVSGKKYKPETAEKAIEDGTCNVVFSTSHLSQGWNAPRLNTILMIEDKDRVIVSQRSGRIIRKSAVKPIVLNLWDSVGHTVDDREKNTGIEILSTHAHTRSTKVCEYYKVKPKMVRNLDFLT